MIHYVNVNGQKHPFKIGMREHQLLYRNAISIDADLNNLKGMTPDEAQGKISVDFNEVLRKVTTDFDTFLEMFHLASVKGCRLHKRETDEYIEPLTMEQIEDAVDDDPQLYINLQDVFIQSNTTDSKPKKKQPKP